MIGAALMAVGAGALVGLSRQVNGRLAQGTSALAASFWNHAVGALALLAAALALAAPLVPAGAGDAPLWAWGGGALGVLFVALGSWLVARLGAARTAVLVIAGQMLAGALLDAARGEPGTALRLVGVAVILAGVWLARD